MNRQKHNKKGEMSEMIKIISWIVFMAIILGGLYFLIKRFNVG